MSSDLTRALIADLPLTSVAEAIRLIEHLVDMTDPHDRVGGALTILVRELEALGTQLQNTQADFGTVEYQRDAMRPVVEALDQHERRYQTAASLRDPLRAYRAAMAAAGMDLTRKEHP